MRVPQFCIEILHEPQKVFLFNQEKFFTYHSLISLSMNLFLNMVIGIIMNGNHQNGHKISEESIKYHSIRPLRPNLIGSINISASFHESETKQKASSRSKSSLLDLSEMKKRPDFLNHLYTAIQIEKNLKLGVTYELNFSIRYETCFGERIVIAGTPEFLGN